LQRKSELNFESILIVTYARSGSTLLQGILNSIDGVVIRGENENLCYSLFKAHEAIVSVHGRSSISSEKSTSPFYGAGLMDERYFLKEAQKLLRRLLLGKRSNDKTMPCYGFKEIRYIRNLQDLPKYLEFLAKIFPSPCFIFNV
jgi:hypothetical protein